MDKNSNLYITMYAGMLTVIVAVVLALTASSLAPLQKANQRQAKMQDILLAVGVSDLEDVEAFFNTNIQSLVINHLGEEVQEHSDPLKIDLKKEGRKPLADQEMPLWAYDAKEAGKLYVIPVYGSGLWDDIWGYIALDASGQTIFGVTFDHKAETPGLGAEIKDKSAFREAFSGKLLFNKGEFVSVEVKKGALTNKNHQVESISGATITSNGVTEMLKTDLQAYMPFFDKLKQGE